MHLKLQRLRRSDAFLFVCFFSLSVASQETCYFPNGNPAHGANFLPCNSTTGVSCCAETDACLANGLCFSGDMGVPYRGACTDRTWKSQLCPTYCNDVQPDAWSNIFRNGQYLWCASESGADFGSTTSTVSWPTPGYVMTVLNAASIPTSSATVTSVGAVASGSTGTPVATATATGSAAMETGQATTAKNETATAIGAGIGVPLGVLALGLLGFLFWRHRTNLAAAAKAGAPPDGAAGWPQQQHWDGMWGEKTNVALPHFRQEMPVDPPLLEMPNGRSGLTQELDSRIPQG